MKKHEKILSRLAQVTQYVVLIFLALVVFIPIIAVLFTAFKQNSEYTSTSVLTLPQNLLNMENFKTAFTQGNMVQGFGNTVFILFFSLIGTVLTGTMVAFVFSRFQFKFNRFVNLLFLGAVVIPGIATQIATFQIISGLGLFNTRLSAIVLYCGTDIMAIYIFLQFLKNIPVSLDESAIVDGASYFTIYGRIIMPLLSPAIITVLITKGISIYNDFYTPFLYMPKKSLLTISTTLFKFKGPYGAHWEIICAGIIVIMIPTVVVFMLLQKKIYSGLVQGAVKE